MDVLPNNNDRRPSDGPRPIRAVRLWVMVSLACAAPVAALVFSARQQAADKQAEDDAAARIVALAAPTAEAPGTGGPGGPMPRPGGPGAFGPRGPAWSRPSTQGSQPDKIPDEVANFMREHSPQKWAMSEKLFNQPSPDNTWKQRMRAGIIDRYTELKKLEKQDPKAYELEVNRITIEDGMFAAMAEYRTAASQEQKEKSRQLMRQRVAELIDNRQAERRLRLDRLETQAKVLRTEIKKVDDEKETQITAQTDQNLRPVHAHHHGQGGPGGPGDRGERRGERPDRNDKGDRAGEAGDRTD